MKVQVRKGDSLGYFSQLFDVPLVLMIDSNPKVNPSKLTKGEMIHIPGFETVPYTIKTGDSFWKIAMLQNIAADAIMILNQQYTAGKLPQGDTLLLPRRVKICIQTVAPCDYKRYNEMLCDLKKHYPFIKINKIGTSVLGRSIQEIRIGRGNKIIHFNGAFHANEWITTLILMRLVNSFLLLVTNGNSAKKIYPLSWYQNVELSLVPMVNPDGVDLVINGAPPEEREKILKMNGGSEEFVHWKANIRGVDLNKQYPANWKIDQRKAPQHPSPRDYPGEAPLTEPEAITMADLANRNHFDCCLAFHTQGEEFYWGYEGYEPPESAEMAKEFEKSSGYKAVQYVNSHAGYKDWFLQEFKRPAFTIELGKGINPLPLSQFNDILRKVEGIFFAVISK